MLWLPILLLGFTPIFAAEMPAQAARGKKIFFDAEQKAHCGTCHQLNKAGLAVGPDISKLARLSPRAILIAMMSSRTMYAKEIELKSAEKFPAMVVSETATEVKLFDLSKLPPEAKTLPKAEVQSIKDNSTWKHPPESTGYTDAQLADVIAFIRFEAFGDTKEVSPDEVR